MPSCFIRCDFREGLEPLPYIYAVSKRANTVRPCISFPKSLPLRQGEVSALLTEGIV